MLNQTIEEGNRNNESNIERDNSHTAIQERLVITPITHRMDDTVRDEEEIEEIN